MWKNLGIKQALYFFMIRIHVVYWFFRQVNDAGDSYTYKWNPCTPIGCVKGTKPTAAVCQTSTNGKYTYDCGDQSTALFSYTNNVLTMTFDADPRKSIITCACGNTESFVLTEDSNPYLFTFTSKCCCPNGCGGGGLSFGSILLIIFFVSLAAYFIFGFVFMKFVKKAEGKDTIPNYTFWTGLPADVKDGLTFVKGKLTSKSYSQI